jgi:hypothetical protein
MPLNASTIKTSSKPRVQQDELEIGTYMCRVAQVIDMGIRPREKWEPATNSFVVDESKAPAQAMMVTYEFTTEFVKDADGNPQEDKPRWLSENLFLFSLEVDLATSTKRYKAIDPTMAVGGDWTKLVNAPCMVTIVHKKNGKAKIGSVTPIPKGIPVAELKNDPKVFLMDEPDTTIFESLPDWLQGKIKEALNYRGSALQTVLEVAGEPAKPMEEETTPAPGATQTTQNVASAGNEEEAPW